MKYLLPRALLAVAVVLVIGLVIGVFPAPVRGLALFSAGSLCLIAYRARWRKQGERNEAGSRADSSAALVRDRERAAGLSAADATMERTQARSSVYPINTATAQSCGVSVLDGEYRIRWCNNLSAAHFGIRLKADMGQPINHVVRESSLSAYVAAGDFSKPLRLRTARYGGRTLSVWVAPHVDSQWLLLSLDVTQSDKLEIMRRDRIADAMHELSTPITVLIGTLDAMRNLTRDPRRQNDCLDSMEKQCRCLLRTFESLLKLSKLESIPKPSDDERIDLRMLLAAAQAEAEALSSGRHRITVDAESGPDLLGSSCEISSAFGNLASNAVRYTPPGGEIRLVWRSLPAGGAEFAVEDNGIGIAKEHIPRLTERFYRVDREFSRKSGGTGLGLAIVKDVLARHQAKLEIESEPGRGSRFAARFPAQRVIMPAARSASAGARNLLISSLLPGKGALINTGERVPVRAGRP